MILVYSILSQASVVDPVMRNGYHETPRLEERIPMAADTDRVWDNLAKTDPYWAVLTLPQFHKDQLTKDTLADFFSTGERHVEFVLDTIHSHFDPSFAP